MERGAILAIAVLTIGVIVTGAGIATVFFSQDIIDALIDSELPLTQGSASFQRFKKPPVTPLLKIYFFNVANPKEFMGGKEKLRLTELGPFVYREELDKKDIVWHANGTVSYREEKKYTFDQNKSIGLETDVLTLPNIPVLTALAQVPRLTKAMQQGMKSLFEQMNLQPFSVRNVAEHLWGYEDPLVQLSKQFLPEGKRPAADLFGLMAGRNATPSDVFTVTTGHKTLDEVAQIVFSKGQSKMEQWDSEPCNIIRGSDGTAFPPKLAANSHVYIYQPDFCRTLDLNVKMPELKWIHQGHETLRFQPADHVFGTVEEHPENACFCKEKICAPKGTFNVSKCQFGAPIFLSWPHFLYGDPTLQENIEGLKPDPEKHQFYIDLLPKLGLAMQVKARMQLNIQMKKVPEIPVGVNLSDIMVPVVWYEDGFDELPDEVIAKIGKVTKTPQVAKTTMSYLLLIVGGLSVIGAVLYLLKTGITSHQTEEINPCGDCQLHNNRHSNRIEMGEITDYPKAREVASGTNEGATKDNVKE